MKSIKNFEHYLIGDTGKVVNSKTGRVLKLAVTPSGYNFVILSKSDRTKTKSVHRLVYETFVGKIPFNEIVTKSIVQHKTIFEVPESDVSQEIKKIWAKIKEMLSTC